MHEIPRKRFGITLGQNGLNFKFLAHVAQLRGLIICLFNGQAIEVPKFEISKIIKVLQFKRHSLDWGNLSYSKKLRFPIQEKLS